MPHASFDTTRCVAHARQSRALFRAFAIIGGVVFAPGILSAQSYFAPLVTPPASAGTCMSVRPVRPIRGDTGVESGRHLVMKSMPPGDTRDIIVYSQRGRPVFYNDMTSVLLRPGASVGGNVLARIDSVGTVRGLRWRDSIAYPDSVITMHPDTASLRRLLASRPRETGVTRAPLTAAEEVRVRAMAAWLLRRCPARP